MNEYKQLMDCGLVAENLDVTYKEVKDFKWHRTQASPNWGLLEELVKEASARGSVEGSGRNTDFYNSVLMWQPPSEAFKVGFTNKLLPIAPPDAPTVSKASASTTTGGDDDSEDEL
jgi:hypothetical protein